MMVGSDILPDQLGRAIGNNDLRYDGWFRNLNVNGVVSGTFTGLAVFQLIYTPLAFSATPVFDWSLAFSYGILLTGNVTASTFINAATGNLVLVEIQQDGTGGRTWTWPGNVRGGMAIGNGPNEMSTQLFHYNGLQFVAVGPGVIS